LFTAENAERAVKNKGKVLSFVFVLCVLCGETSFAAGATAVDKLHAFVDGTKSARANFSQVVVGKSGRKPQQASGTMAFSRPAKFRWTYEKPYQQLIVGDGEKLWVYDKDLNQVTVKTLGQALGSSPAALLAGDNAIDKNFALREGETKDGIDWVEAQAKAQDTSFERLRIGFAGDALRIMEIVDNFGQTTTLTFGTIERNPPLPASLFHFAPPKGADVVGE
jgi:outer membrane lipoprotein carrier protein